MSWASLIVAIVVTGADADLPEVQTIAVGNYGGRGRVVFSPDGERIAALRSEPSIPPGREMTHHIDFWKVADIEAFAKSAEKPTSEIAETSPAPVATFELKECDRPDHVCFTKAGELVVFARETGKNGHLIWKGSRGWTVATADEAQQAKAAGRKTSRFQRAVILFLDPDSLAERRRWIDENNEGHAQADLVEFPAGQTVVHFGSSGVRLLENTTGEEFERLRFDRDRPNEHWGIWGGEARIAPGGRTCLVAAGSGNRHAVWRLAADRKVTMLAEIDHGRLAGALAVSPQGNVLALAASPPGIVFGRTSAVYPVPRGETLELWDVETRKTRQELIGHEFVAGSLDFSPDGKRLASSSWGTIGRKPFKNKYDPDPTFLDATLILWDVATGKQLLHRQLDEITILRTVQFSPDGERLLTFESIEEPNNYRRRIRLWNVERMLTTGKPAPRRPRL